MLSTITLIISLLVFVNFLLLKFSVNKINKQAKTEDKTIVVLNPDLKVASSSEKLAPTGS